MQGIKLLDTIYAILLQRKVNDDYIEKESRHWLNMLIKLVEITETPESCFLRFFSGEEEVAKRYKEVSVEIVSKKKILR